MNNNIDPNVVPIGTKIVLTVLAVVVVVGIIAALGPIGAVSFGIFAAISVLNRSPRSNARGRDEPGEF